MRAPSRVSFLQLAVVLYVLGSTTPLVAALQQGGGQPQGKTNGKVNGHSEQHKEDEPSDVHITAKAGEGIKIVAGDAFSLGILSWVQPRYRFVANDSSNPASNGGAEDVSNFRIKRARTRFSGNVFGKDVEYRLLLDWIETVPVKDAWVKWAMLRDGSSAVSLRFGQQKTMYGRESTASDYMLDFVDRALASNTFSNSRSRGAMFLGDHLDGRLHWTAGAFNTDVAAASSNAGEEAANPDNELDYVFTVRADPAGDMGDEAYAEGDLDGVKQCLWSIGAGLQLANHRAVIGGVAQDADGIDVNLNAGAKYRGFHALAEVFLRSDDPGLSGTSSSDAHGWQAGLTYCFPKPGDEQGQWTVGGRYSALTLEDAAQVVLTGTPLGPSKGDVDEITLLVGHYYRGHKLKAQASWTLQTVDPDGSAAATNHILEVQVQFLF